MATILAVVRYLVIASLALLIINRNISLKKNNLIVCIMMVLFILINILIADGGISLMAIILFVLSSKNYSLLKIYKYTVFALTASTLIVVVFARIGILQDEVSVRYISDITGGYFSGNYYRHNMGFLIHNQIPLTFFILYLYIIVIKRENLTIIDNALFMALNYLVFRNFGSRIVFLLTIVCCIAFYIIKTKQAFKIGICGYLWIFSFVLCAFASLTIVTAYHKSDFFELLNLFFNNRIKFANEAIRNNGLSMLGAGKNAVTYSGISNVTVDNGYINMLIGDGMVVFGIIIGAWSWITAIARKKKNEFLVMVLVFLALENLINSHLGSVKLIPYFCILLNSKDEFVESGSGHYFLKRRKRRSMYTLLKLPT